jgi:hypothetical protein
LTPAIDYWVQSSPSPSSSTPVRRRDATSFRLEARRLCVLASRHWQACIMVARAGIADQLDTQLPTDPIHLGVTARFPDGWEASHAVLVHLDDRRVPA